jgi:coenzyme Q-binding protein COQ10
MPQFSAKRRVPYSASRMFDLVANVEEYPEFVPLCTAMRVLSRQEKKQGEGSGISVVVAEMTIAYKLIRQTFTSRVTLDRSNLEILVDYLKGPFTHMRTRWVFHAFGDDACDVEFFTEYEFRSRTFAALMGAMFDAVFRRMVSAFEKRAAALYGRGPVNSLLP